MQKKKSYKELFCKEYCGFNSGINEFEVCATSVQEVIFSSRLPCVPKGEGGGRMYTGYFKANFPDITILPIIIAQTPKKYAPNPQTINIKLSLSFHSLFTH